jgi:hypothetical protein
MECINLAHDRDQWQSLNEHCSEPSYSIKYWVAEQLVASEGLSFMELVTFTSLCGELKKYACLYPTCILTEISGEYMFDVSSVYY